MTPLDAMRDALEEMTVIAGDPWRIDAIALIDALNKRNVILVAVDPKVAPLFIQTRDSGKWLADMDLTWIQAAPHIWTKRGRWIAPRLRRPDEMIRAALCAPPNA